MVGDLQRPRTLPTIAFAEPLSGVCIPMRLPATFPLRRIRRRTRQEGLGNAAVIGGLAEIQHELVITTGIGSVEACGVATGCLSAAHPCASAAT